MKFLVVFAFCVLAASAKPTEPIPELKPAPISVGPAIIDGAPIFVGPAIVGGEYEPISVGPAIVDGVYEPISVGPAIIDNEVAASASSPLVQIIVNVNPNSGIVGSPVIVEGMPEPVPISVDPVIIDEIKPTPVIVVGQPEPVPISVDPVIIDEIKPTPVIVVDQPEPEPENVIIVEQPEPEALIPPVVALPGILN
ncbi:unnamed protein product, partial [Brenthis ino]